MPRQYREPIYVIGPSIAYIPLTRGQFATVDWDDAIFLSQWNWCVGYHNGKYRYAYRGTRAGGVNKTIYLHCIICHSEEDVDHINGHKRDCRRANLRVCTKAQNAANTGLISTNTSGYKGVIRTGDRWRAVIKVDQKAIYLGTFVMKEEAHKAYIKAARYYFGEFARIS